MQRSNDTHCGRRPSYTRNTGGLERQTLNSGGTRPKNPNTLQEAQAPRGAQRKGGKHPRVINVVMTSGKRKEPTEITCERCGKTALWTGGRRKRFCSPTCSHGYRTGSQPRKPKDPRSRTVKQTQQSRQLKIDRGQCTDCGLIITWHNVVCIDWDHRNPLQKSFTISHMVGKAPWQTIAEEIAKCDAVCRNCHALRTHHKQQHQPVNGRTTIKLNRGVRNKQYKTE